MEKERLVAEENEATQAAVQAKEPVNYALTWPGILPDHFLYPLKMVRDRLWLGLTSDPQDKAELLLKMADKRVWASQMLLDKGKEDKALTTATKAEKYLERAVSQAKVAQEKGKDVGYLWDRLVLASQKHEEVLGKMKESLSDSGKGVMEEILKYPKSALEESQKAMEG